MKSKWSGIEGEMEIRSGPGGRGDDDASGYGICSFEPSDATWTFIACLLNKNEIVSIN